MNDAEIYRQNNTVQKRDAFECLNEYGGKINWRRIGEKILDIGCGDGSVTANLLKEFIPNNFEKLIGCDISENMVTYANRHYEDGRTKFSILDIQGRLPDHMRETFDHVFSFYALHWIHDQESAFENIYNLLIEGGECLLAFLGHNPIYNVYRLLSRSSKWGPWLKGIDEFVSPYHDSQDPESEIKKLLTRVGFTNITVKCQEKSFIYDSPAVLKTSVRAIHPFHMPNEVFEDFMSDYLDIVQDMKLKEELNNNKSAGIRINYNLIVVYAKK